MFYYFAYGSNMNPARVEFRGLSVDHYEGGVLSGYRLAFNKRSVKHEGAASANVIAVEGDRVEGVIYKLRDPGQIEIMDPFEGYPVRYTRELLPIECASGTREAWVYIANAEYVAQGLKPARWYLNHLLEGRPWLSDDYIRRLRQVECLPFDEEPD